MTSIDNKRNDKIGINYEFNLIDDLNEQEEKLIQTNLKFVKRP